VELYNPKVIRATMGSLFHVAVSENVELSFFSNLQQLGFEIFCSDLEGQIFSDVEKPEKLVLCFSNETNGPSQELLDISNFKLTIPKKGNAESLNVASASAILLNYFSCEP